MQWWKNAVVYQIYPRSFQDSNGDGIGDIPGIISRLDYLSGLGIDAIWLSPVCRSPQEDNGYDISDYQDIDPLFGTLEDMDRLIAEAKKRGIRIILDLVLNHTSSQHPWFTAASTSRESPCHEYYVWRDGTPDTPPNGLQSVFGGPAWTWAPQVGRWYLHQFAPGQPDLNWHNPKVRQTLYDMIQWWTNRGIGGFRLDVIDRVAKEPDQLITEDGPLLHTWLREMSAKVFAGTDLLTVGEAWSASTESAPLYSNPDGSELSMVFQFEHMLLDQQKDGEKWDAIPLNLLDLKEVITRWQTSLQGKGWNSLFLCNHDLPRIVSRWGNDGEYREQSAKMLAIWLHGLQGTPYIYQGEELGMTNLPLQDIRQCRDIEALNCYRDRVAAGQPADSVLRAIEARGRDNARTPMQWTAADNAGFTTGTPWIEVNPNYTGVNAALQVDDPASIYSTYKQLIGLRKRHPVFSQGSFQLLAPEHPHVFAYQRGYEGKTLTVVCNFSQDEQDCEIALPPAESFILGSYTAESSSRLRPYEARMYLG